MDRLNTKIMLQRRNLNVQGGTNCIMCSSGNQEDIEHLFFGCTFAQQCWTRLGISWDSSLPVIDRLANPMMNQVIPCSTEVMMIAAWELWKVRNDKVFQRHEPILERWIGNFKNQCYLQSCRFKADLRSSFCVWLDALS